MDTLIKLFLLWYERRQNDRDEITNKWLRWIGRFAITVIIIVTVIAALLQLAKLWLELKHLLSSPAVATPVAIITATPSAEAIATETALQNKYVAAWEDCEARIREAPSTDSRILTQREPRSIIQVVGAVVGSTVYGLGNIWLQVRLEYGVGYIHQGLASEIPQYRSDAPEGDCESVARLNS